MGVLLGKQKGVALCFVDFVRLKEDLLRKG